MVSRVGCGAWLYQLLILVFFFTLNNKRFVSSKNLDKPANMRSLIDASAFLSVFTLYVVSVWSMFYCICLCFLVLFVLILYK